MSQIRIEQWNESQFANASKEWNQLLSRSDADKLFLSWEWQYSWWNHYNDYQTMKLMLFAARDNNNQLVGIAPLYVHRTKLKGFLPTRRLQFIGNCWKASSNMPTELLSLIIDNAYHKSVIDSIYKYINSLNNWDEFFLQYCNIETATYKVLLNGQSFSNCYLRKVEQYNSYYLNLNDSFEHYLKRIGKNTRLKLYNRRKLLSEHGNIVFSSSNDIDNCFKLLNELHYKRWKKNVFMGVRLDFNTCVAKLLNERDALEFSFLYIDNKPISIQYNYIIDGVKYNIQAGFDECFHKKISLGYLHFGYEIEKSINVGLHRYDFLAGAGMNTQYKERLTKSHLIMNDILIIRNKLHKLIYYCYDLLMKLKI